MSIDLSLYLLVAQVHDLDGVIPLEKQGPAEFQQVSIRDGFSPGVEMTCWLKTSFARPADWTGWLEEGFDFGERRPQSQSSGCVVLVNSRGRVFAACFGTGRHAIPDILIEYDFGLTVALNEVDPRRLRALVTKTIDVKTRQRDTHKLGGANVPEFALDLDVEWLRAAEGRTDRQDCTLVAGSDSLHLRSWKRPLVELSAACGEFLASFQRGIPETFSFAESVKPIPENDPLHAKLEGDLEAAIQLRYFEQLAFEVEVSIARATRRAVLLYGKQQIDIAELDDDSLSRSLDVLSQIDPQFNPMNAQVRLLDREEAIILQRSLTGLIQMEIDRDGESFVRIEKRWFRCREDYIRRVQGRIDALEDMTAILSLPPWCKAQHRGEEDYLRVVAREKGWLLQDQQFFYSPHGEKVEPCDLLTSERHFIHLKEGRDSSSLSHLFSQASGSADLLWRHQPFFDEMRQRFEAHWTGASFNISGRPTIVLAIARPLGADLFGKMLLSRINVLEHARRVQGHGFGFALARVDLVDIL